MKNKIRNPRGDKMNALALYYYKTSCQSKILIASVIYENFRKAEDR